MATYNGQRYIKEQIESIISQLDIDDELIISDDSSTDATISIINDFRDKRIVLKKNNKFYSPIFNFENALRYAKGDFIFLSDQDDVWKPDKVTKIKNMLNHYDLVVSNCEIIDKNNKTIHESFFKINNSKKGIIWNIYRNSYLGCCMAFRKKILDKALPFPKNIPMHDIWLGAIGDLFGNALFTNEILVSYRRHNYNASTATQKSSNNILNKLKYRLILIYNLILRAIES
jgi:glycosyltransferase involved in cell wall biosynthesis